MFVPDGALLAGGGVCHTQAPRGGQHAKSASRCMHSHVFKETTQGSEVTKVGFKALKAPNNHIRSLIKNRSFDVLQIYDVELKATACSETRGGPGVPCRSREVSKG